MQDKRQDMATKTHSRVSLTSQVSVDTHPLPGLGPGTLSGHVTADALAGPEVPSQQTGELKEEAGRDQARQPHSFGQSTRMNQLQTGKFQGQRTDGSGSRQPAGEFSLRMEKLSLASSPSSEQSPGSKSEDSSYGSMSSGDFSSSSMPSDDWEDDIRQYKDKLPPDLKFGFIDVLILYCEDDRAQAEKFRDHLMEEIEIKEGPMIAMLYDAPELQAICGSQIQHLAKGVERSTYVFIFMTKNFVQDKWCEFSSESCLMEAITNPLKQWCVVPVYTEKRNTSFRVPMGLNTLKGINYYNNDRFYRNGVARLIGDKIYARKQKNLEHKSKQKQKIEEIKREEIKLREDQRRIQVTEEAKTQQLIDWLEHETKRLVRDGVLPGSMFHSSSESDVSSSISSLPHSASTSSLKPLQPQYPAVASYFQQLLGQQKVYGHNEANYTHEQIQFIERMFGSGSPTGHNYSSQPPHQGMYTQSPPGQPYMMNYFPAQRHLGQGQWNHGYQGQGHWSQGNQGNFPPAQNAEQNTPPQQLKRNPPQASADMGPSTEFILPGNIPVDIPTSVYEKIKDLPEAEQQKYVAYFIEEQKRALMGRNEQMTMGNSGQNLQQPSSTIPSGVPNFSILNEGSQPSSFSSGHETTMNSHPQMSASGHSHSGQGLESQRPSIKSMDANKSNAEGNFPLLSMLNTDGGTSMYSQPVSAHQTTAKGRTSVKAYSKSARLTPQGIPRESSDEDDEEEEEKREFRPKKRNNATVIHKTITYNIINPSAVQIGEGNVVNHSRDDSEETGDSDMESETEESTQSKGEDASPVDDREMNSSEIGEKLKKMDIPAGSESRSEIGDQPEASRNAGSCMPDAAPSTHQPALGSSASAEPQAGPQVKARGDPGVLKEEKLQKSIKSEKDYDNTAEFEKESDEENTNQKSNDRGLEGSVNLNSTVESPKSSSLKKVILPDRPKLSCKPQCVAAARFSPGIPSASPERQKEKPTAAVSPFSPSGTSVDENCECTEPKTVVQSDETFRKRIGGASNVFEETFVKQAWSGESACSTGEDERPCQMLTKSKDGRQVESGVNRFTSSRQQQTDPRNLFYHNHFPAKEDDNANTHESLEDSINSSIKPVEIGEDPLSAEISGCDVTSGFIEQTTAFNRQSSSDRDYEMVPRDCEEFTSSSSASFEQSGSKGKNGWQSKGAHASEDKNCRVS